MLERWEREEEQAKRGDAAVARMERAKPGGTAGSWWAGCAGSRGKSCNC